MSLRADVRSVLTGWAAPDDAQAALRDAHREARERMRDTFARQRSSTA